MYLLYGPNLRKSTSSAYKLSLSNSLPAGLKRYSLDKMSCQGYHDKSGGIVTVTRIGALIVVVLLVGYFVMRWLVVLNSPRPNNLGIQERQLRPCPDSPNCVSSFSSSAEQAIEPIEYSEPTAQMRERLLNALAEMPRTTVVTNEPDYIHAEIRTRLWGFIDDAEFYFDEANDTLHMRSGARLGYGDMGVNRRNLEQIRNALVE